MRIIKWLTAYIITMSIGGFGMLLLRDNLILGLIYVFVTCGGLVYMGRDSL